jgi:hypothetical protein
MSEGDVSESELKRLGDELCEAADDVLDPVPLPRYDRLVEAMRAWRQAREDETG